MLAELFSSLGEVAGFLLLLAAAYLVGGAFVGGTFYPQLVGSLRDARRRRGAAGLK